MGANGDTEKASLLGSSHAVHGDGKAQLLETPAAEDGKKKAPTVPVTSMWRFATGQEHGLLAVAVLASIAHGVLMPLFSVLFGDVIDTFDPENSEEMTKAVSQICIKFLVLAAIAGSTAYLQMMLFTVTGTRQANRMRERYFQAVLRQDMAWHDLNKSGEVATRLAGDVLLVQEAISDKAGGIIQYGTTFVAGFAIGFSSGWQMALVILAVVPVLAICGAVMGTLMMRLATKGQAAYASAGAVAEEVISSVRTVAAFGGETNEVVRYSRELENARAENTKKGLVTGVAIGTTLLCMFCSYALAFWYGSTLVEEGIMTAGDVVTTFFAVIMGGMSVGQAAPLMSALSTGAGAAYKIFEVIDRTPAIDALSDAGISPPKVSGNVEFRNVHFRYPSRPLVAVLNGLNFSIAAGQTLALVGPSGCGKSTSVSLLERFYDAMEGQVLVDGIDVRELNIKWLRAQIGVVSQEPVLFNKTIAQNIEMGKPGATLDEIHEAARQANAHNFITRLPLGYDTPVGPRGTQLSGGQKQRIAIARAIVKNPRILLLDEATSALDTKSERLVQRALDQASKGRTTLVIAHRLSTIVRADKIAVIQQGVIVEQGTHAELIERPNGIFAHMVQLQSIRGTEGALATDNEVDDAVDTTEDVPTAAPPAAATGPGASDKDAAAKDAAAKDAAAKDAAPVLLADTIETKGVVGRTYRMNAPETWAIVIGTVAATVNGAVFPLFAIIFSELLSDLLMLTGDELAASVRFWSLIFVALGGVVFFANLGQHWMFAISGEHLTFRLRRMFFQALLRQEIGWFDDHRHSTGVLSTKLANDIALIEGITGQRLGMVAQLAGTIIGGLTIAFVSIWQLALVILSCVPIIATGGLLRMRLMLGFNKSARAAYEQSGHVAAEAAENVRTVAMLGQEGALLAQYRAELAVPDRAAARNAHIGGLTFGFTESSAFCIMSLAFYYGALLISWELADFAAMMRVIYAVVFCAMTLGQTAAMAGDWSKAVLAAAEVFYIVDRVSSIDVTSDTGRRLERVRGDVKFDHVTFAYPQRPDAVVLAGLSVSVPAGKTLALVGHSGCGKSTTVQLLQRFYDPASGVVSVDGVDVRELNLEWLRSQIGTVNQEPVLFNTTLRENILYGKRNATDDEIFAAARAANAHDFIVTLPDGYETLVGEKGIQLSGGQKQRVAIARALVRNPPILLLDEATSALDSQSEAVVQAALDRARVGRTSIVIAHRLSTIQNADMVAVVQNGVIAEIGTHNDLLAQHGLYFELVQNQAVGMAPLQS